MKDRISVSSIASALSIVFSGLVVSHVAEAEVPDEEIIELSPFVVDGSKDSGYRAQNTLAGTRLKSDLDDISASLSVFTGRFLEDIGATNAQDALLYSVNTENEDEYFTDDVGGQQTQRTTSTRVRGLTIAANSRNFFETELRADTYNTERITTARGPNSILFGIGSASGAIDSTYKMAMFTDEAKVEFRTDQHGSFRTVVDLNKNVSDQFAVRLIGMNQDKKSFIDPERDHETRFFATATYRPFEKTTVRAYYESMDLDRNRARRTLPIDGITEWIAKGKPLYDNLNGVWVDAAGNEVDASDFGFVPRKPRTTYIFSNGLDVPTSEILPYGIQVQPALIKTSATIDSTDSFLDDSIIPYDRNIFGRANGAKMDADVLGLTLEQRIGWDLGFEFSYYKEGWNYDGIEAMDAGGLDSRVLSDVNLYLYDDKGAVTDVRNPNAGRYYVESGTLTGTVREVNREVFRLTASYDLDLTDKSAWLGDHRISALYQWETKDSSRVLERAKNLVGGTIDPGFGYSSTNQNVNGRAYLDLGGELSDGSGVFSIPAWKPPVENGLSFWPISYGANHEKPTHAIRDTKSAMAAIQSFFDLPVNDDDELVVTFGVRTDTVDVTSIPGSAVKRNDQGVFQWKHLPVNVPVEGVSGTTGSLGFVYHTPLKGFSLLYSKSNNFNQQTGFKNYEGNPIPASEGKTSEYGLAFESADKKFYARLVNYKTFTVNQVETDYFFVAPNWNVIYQMEDMITQWVDIYASRGEDRSGDLAPMAAEDKNWYWNIGEIYPINDRTSEGYELELFYAPTSNLNLRLSVAKTDAVHSKLARGLINYIDSRWDVWEKYKTLVQPSYVKWAWEQDVIDGKYDDAFAYSEHVWDPQPNLLTNYYSVAYGTWGIPIYTDEAALPRVEEIKALEGRSTQRSRKWRVNLTCNYDFTEGPLKNLGLGGAVRYRSGLSIGSYGKKSDNPSLPDGVLVADLARPIFGDDIFEFDFWVSYAKPFKVGERAIDWTIAMYIQNAFSDGGVTPSSANFDGTYSSMMIKAPRNVSVTTSFRF